MIQAMVGIMVSTHHGHLELSPMATFRNLVAPVDLNGGLTAMCKLGASALVC